MMEELNDNFFEEITMEITVLKLTKTPNSLKYETLKPSVANHKKYDGDLYGKKLLFLLQVSSTEHFPQKVCILEIFPENLKE